MKKLFFAICFMSTIAWATYVGAASRELIDPIEINKVKNNQDISQPEPRDGQSEVPQSKEELQEYIKERAKTVIKSNLQEIEENSGIGIIHSDEYIAQQAQDNKSTFQKIYEEALSKVTLDEYMRPVDDLLPSAPSDAKLKSEIELENLSQSSKSLGFDVISVDLPNGQKVVAPAKEHIPYMSSKIEIMPNGIVRIKDTVTVIANGQKLKYGLIKALPKYSVSRNRVKNTVIPYLNSVKINGTEVEYTLKDAFDRFLIKPKKQFPLQPGIYHYEFDYILDRKLWYYKNFNEFYWDVTGSYWNLVVSKAIATVRLPIDVRALGQNLMVGFLPNDITEEGTVISMDRATHGLGFTTEVPLVAGEGMFMLVRIPKAGFIEPDFGKKFKWFIEDYGEIIFALIGLVMILGAYLISWKNIDRSAKDGAKINFQRTPTLYRMLAKGIYDKISFGSFLLDMYKHGAINILRNKDDSISLTKRSDNFKELDAYHRKALQQIFGKKDKIFTVRYDNITTLNKASKLIEKDTCKRLKMLLLKLNMGYVVLSGIMVLLTEFAIASLKVDTWSTFGILVASTITIAFYCFILFAKIKNKFVMVLAKLFAFILIITAAIIMTVYIKPVSALLIVVMVIIIFMYSRLFTRRDGLIRHHVAEAKNMAENLRNSAEAIILGKQFANSQPNILALDAFGAYSKTRDIEDVYKLDLIQEIIKML